MNNHELIASMDIGDMAEFLLQNATCRCCLEFKDCKNQTHEFDGDYCRAQKRKSSNRRVIYEAGLV